MTRDSPMSLGVLAVFWLLLLQAGASLAREDPCRDARSAFAKGIGSFERTLFDDTIVHMRTAMVREKACDRKDKLSVIYPVYGRWRYEFTPEIYLGLALARNSECSLDSVRQSTCRFVVAGWRLEPEMRECLREVPAAHCDQSGLECEVAVDWWRDLSSFAAAETTTRKAGDYRSECQEIWSAMTLFRGVLVKEENQNQLACDQLADDLTGVVKCSGTRGAHP